MEPALHPMEAERADELPRGSGWQFEPKWDGFRAVAQRDGGEIALYGKSGKPLGRYFPEIVAALRAAKPRRFAVDGELIIPIGDELSFDALQMRLHPAESRIKKLSAETPAIYVLFDILSEGARDFSGKPLEERRAALEALFPKLAGPRFRLSPYTRDRRQAARWLSQAGGALDGVVAKELGQPYLFGERAMVKVKLMRTADCVVGGFRYAQNKPEVGSLLLGLYNAEGLLDHVGFTSSIPDPKQLTKRLEKLRGAPGFTGDAPGGPSRWSTERSAQWEPLKPKLVAEVRYDHVSGGRFRHGTKFLRWRPDKPPKTCTMDQLEHEARPGKIAALIGK